jgi:ethanolamine utilization microcompartment shell protein EutS
VSSVTARFPGITVNEIAFGAMGLDAALASIQGDRASLLNTQLAAQITDVQARNARIGSANAALSALTAYLASPTEAAFTAASNAVKAAGVEHAFLSATAGTGAASASALATNLRGQIDSMSNSQQMDMLRLQSLTNKRNEAFDVMTDFAKKMQEARSSIIGNMRSTPVALGTVQWDSGAVTGSFDLTGVPNGEHHLILTFADAGVTLVANVTVQRGELAAAGGQLTPGRGELAATGGQLTPAMGLGVGLLVLGCAAVVGAPLLRRRDVTAMRP